MRKSLVGALAFALMTLLVQAQDKPSKDQKSADKTEKINKPDSQKPSTPPPTSVKDKADTKPGPSNPGETTKQKGGVPPIGAGQADKPKEPAKSEPAKGDPTPADWEKLKGEWISVNFEFDGRSYPADGRWSLIFEQTKDQPQALKITGNPPTQVFWTGPIRLDAAKSPREITLVLPALIGERLQRGIYTLQGDYLTIAWSTGFDTARPVNFSAKPDLVTRENIHVQAEPNQFMATWVRKKPAAPK